MGDSCHILLTLVKRKVMSLSRCVVLFYRKSLLVISILDEGYHAEKKDYFRATQKMCFTWRSRRVPSYPYWLQQYVCYLVTRKLSRCPKDAPDKTGRALQGQKGVNALPVEASYTYL